MKRSSFPKPPRRGFSGAFAPIGALVVLTLIVSLGCGSAQLKGTDNDAGSDASGNGRGGSGGTSSAGGAGTGGNGTGGTVGGTAGTDGGTAGGTAGTDGGTAGKTGGTAGTNGGTAGTNGGTAGTAGGAAGTGVAGTDGKAGAAGTGGSGGAGGAPTSCTAGTSCPSGFCNTITQRCVATQCQDGAKDGSETDIDCGGAICPKCDVNKICAADGDCKTGSCSRLFCALVSGPPNWLPGPPLNYGRGFIAAGIALGNGQETFFAIGGRDDVDDSDPALSSYEELFTGSGLAWGPYTDGMGTFGATATDAAGDLLIFSPQSTWSLSVPHVWKMLSTVMPTPRTSAAAVLAPNGLVYVIGGSDTAGNVSGVIEAYDPVMNKWTTGLHLMSTPRTDLAAALGTDGLIYAIGGQTDLSSVATVEAYNVSTNSWSTKSALPANDFFLAAVSGTDGRIYALGGLAGTANAYTPATNRWTPIGPLSDNRSGVGVVVAPDGHIWAIGGTTNPEATGETTVELYGPNVTASPQTGAPGTSVAVNGSNFAANATVSVFFGSVMGAALATGTTNATGALTAPISLTVPSLAAGDQPLIVMDDRSQYPITIEFRVQ